MAETANETGSEGLVGQATSQVQSAASSAQEKAVELKEEGKSRLGDQLDQRTTEAGSQARSFAEALRQTGGALRNQGKNQPAGIAESVADRVERAGGYLERTSGDELLRDVEEFARRRPWLIAGVGLLAGLAASRFLKASSERRYDRSLGQGDGRRSSYGSYAVDEPLARERLQGR